MISLFFYQLILIDISSSPFLSAGDDSQNTIPAGKDHFSVLAADLYLIAYFFVYFFSSELDQASFLPCHLITWCRALRCFCDIYFLIHVCVRVVVLFTWIVFHTINQASWFQYVLCKKNISLNVDLIKLIIVRLIVLIIINTDYSDTLFECFELHWIELNKPLLLLYLRHNFSACCIENTVCQQ